MRTRADQLPGLHRSVTTELFLSWRLTLTREEEHTVPFRGV